MNKNKKNGRMSLGDIIKETLPYGGGATGSLLSVSMGNIIDTMIYAAIGAVIGYIIKLIGDYIVDCRKKKKDECNKEVQGEQESPNTSEG